MAAKSKNKYDVYDWIKNQVIQSCVNKKQTEICEELVINFEKMYNDNELAHQLRLECIKVLWYYTVTETIDEQFR